MNDARPSAGLAARLLDRADGGVSALRPRIAQTFAPEQSRAAPLLERTEEVAASPPATPRRNTPAAPAPVATAPDASAPQERLMPPPAPPASRAAAQADEAAVEPPPGAPLPTSAPSAPASPIAQPSAGPAIPVRPSPRDTHRAQPHPRQADSLSAAVMQLLAPDPAAPVAPREATLAPVRDNAPVGRERSAIPTVSAPVPIPAHAAAEPGLTIHIGEIVVAPEPRPARETASRPVWQPPLSLAEYRATRARERR